MRLDMSNERPRQLFAAMNVLDGTVIGRNMQRHRHLPEACGTFAVADRRDEGADQRCTTPWSAQEKLSKPIRDIA